MGVDIVDVLGIELGPLQGGAHGALRPAAVLGRGRDVMSVTGKAVADDLGIDLGAAPLGMLELFQHDDAGTLAHDEAVAGLVPGTRGALGCVVEAGRESARGGEARDADAADGRLGAAGHHHIGVLEPDQPGGVADGMGPRRAGGDHRGIGPLEAEFDRDIARGQIDQRGRDEEGRDPPRAPLMQQDRRPRRCPGGRRCRSRSGRRCARAIPHPGAASPNPAPPGSPPPSHR